MSLRERLSRETLGGQQPWHVDKLRSPIALAGNHPNAGADVRFEATGARRVVFVGAATPLYSSPNVLGGLLEVKSSGAVHKIDNLGGRIYVVRDKGLLKWVAFQSEFGPAYVQREFVIID